MKNPLHHLVNLLEDEFRDFPEVRIRPVFRSTTQRSPDLPQDYDPESNSLHRRSGVIVQTGRREYYFPEDWMTEVSRSQLLHQIQEIRDFLGEN